MAMSFVSLWLFALSPAQLKAGAIQISGGEIGSELRAVGLVKAPPQKVYETVIRCEGYGGFLPRVVTSKRLSGDERSRTCAMHIDMPFPLGDLKTQLKQTRWIQPGSWRMDFKQIKGGYEENAGGWRLQPYGPAGQWTLVDYRLRLRLKGWVPKWIQNLGAKGSIQPLFQALRNRLE